MNDPSEARTKDLVWIQPSLFSRSCELRANDNVIGTLDFRTAFGSLATGKCKDECWTFKRVGFFQTRVSIRICDDETDVATFRNNTWSGGGTLEFADGGKLLVATNFWQSKLDFKSPSDDLLVSFRTASLIHLKAHVVVEPGAERLSHLPLILLLGWYLVVMMHNDAATSAAIIG